MLLCCGFSYVAVAAATPTPSPGDEVFPTYVPLRSQNQIYDCGQGRIMTISLRPYRPSGLYLLKQTWTFPRSDVVSTTTLQAHDRANNLVLAGTVDDTGAVHRYSESIVYTPLTPSRTFEAKLTSHDNKSDFTRTWKGSTSLDLPIGHYNVQMYNDWLPGSRRIVSDYANNVGLVAFAVTDKDGKSLMQCRLKSVASTPP